MIFLPAALYVALATQPLNSASPYAWIYMDDNNPPWQLSCLRSDPNAGWRDHCSDQNTTDPAPAAPAAHKADR